MKRKIKTTGNAKSAAERYMNKHWCNDGTSYKLTMFSADDNGREWAQLTSYHGSNLLFVRM